MALRALPETIHGRPLPRLGASADWSVTVELCYARLSVRSDLRHDKVVRKGSPCLRASGQPNSDKSIPPRFPPGTYPR